MSVGRNDPCPCGSGKKYKKCCLAEEEEEARKAQQQPLVVELTPKVSLQTEPTLPSESALPSPARAPHSNIEVWNARYDEFEAADYEERIAIFNRTLDEPELMNGEMAFEMLHSLFPQTIEHNERNRFDSLVESLRECLPEVYRQEAGYLLEKRIFNALVMGRPDLVHSLSLEMAALADRLIDQWSQVEECLAYHGYLNTLLDAMRLAWPKIRTSRHIAWGLSEIANQAVQYELYNYAAQTSAPRGDDPVLLEQLKFFLDDGLELDRIAAEIAGLTNQTERQWSLEEFYAPARRPSKGWKKYKAETTEALGNESLTDLTVEFVGYAHRVEGVPYTKAGLARGEFQASISGQKAGKLEPHSLCPNYKQLDQHLGTLLGFLNHQPYKAGALMELVPTWMRFLQSRGLIGDEQVQRTLAEVAPLTKTLLKIFKGSNSDPALVEAMQRWPKKAA